MPFDIPVLDFIQSHLRCDFSDTFLSLVTHLGDAGIFWILLTALLLAFPKTRKTGLYCAAALLLDAIFCNLMLKPLIARTRPFDLPAFATKDIQLLIARPRDYSFPSGHTAASFAVTTVLFFRQSPLRFPSLVLSILIAFSRLYLYVHFPTDVLGGLVVGVLSGVLAILLIHCWEIRKKPANHNPNQIEHS